MLKLGMLDFIEKHFGIVSYLVGFVIWTADMDKILSTDFLIFLILSPLLATITGAIAILALLLIFFPVIYAYGLIKMMICER